MALDYVQLRYQAAAALTENGMRVTFYREGTKVAQAAGIFIASEQADDTSSLLAQTSHTRKTMLVAATRKPLQVGDTMTAGATSYSVTKLTDIAPTGLTVYLKVEVV
jgi:hypothetical protein